MHIAECHLTDRELLHRLDEELSEARKAAVDFHLTECETCRTRSEAITEMASAASSAYRAMSVDSNAQAQSRARLETSLMRSAREAERPRAAIDSVLRTPRYALAGVAAVMAVSVILSLAVRTAPPASRTEVPVAQLGVLPVASLTPGATWAVTTGELCAGTRHTRTITAAMRRDVLAAYRMEAAPADQCELDYLITPELGGATDARNLWPQAYASPVWNARVKDELERLLPQLVCSRQLALETAQRDMAVDWIAAYKKYFKTDLPLRTHADPTTDDDETRSYMLADAGPAPAVRLVSPAVMP
jgi:predicted anti-sigma-YlaC factor YlaD